MSILPDCPPDQPFDIDPYVIEPPWIVTLRDYESGLALLLDEAHAVGIGELDFGDDLVGRAEGLTVFRRFDLAVLSPELGKRVARGLARGDKAHRDALSSLEESGLVFAARSEGSAAEGAAPTTWALDETGVTQCTLSGRGVRVAVLDSGIDFVGDELHEDLRGRSVTMKSFVPGRSAWDDFGHGTHTLGIACGPKNPPSGGARYGIAHEAEIYVGKVLVNPTTSQNLGLRNKSAGAAQWVIDGINWAIEMKCQVVCLSLASSGVAWGRAYEEVAKRALEGGTLLIAAAGNDPPPHSGDPVSVPARCESVLAVGALMQDANGALTPIPQSVVGATTRNGLEVNLVAPGDLVRSSWRSCNRSHDARSGSSVAAPHVAGIAALYAQPREHGGPGLTGRNLWNALEASADWPWPELGDKPPPGRYDPLRGKGIVQAPRL